jgi:hypothetical protein
MASLDFYIPVIPTERNFARSLLGYFRKMAAYRKCTRPTVIKFSWKKPGKNRSTHRYQVSVDGDLAEIQSLCVFALESLPHYANGIKSQNPKIKDSLLDKVIAGALIKCVEEFNDEMNKIIQYASDNRIPLSSNTYIFKSNGSQQEQKILADLTGALLHWRNDRIPPSLVTEHLHTSLEFLLKRNLHKANKGVSFETLVRDAESNGLIIALERDSLIQLKNIRRDSKHRGSPVSQKQLLTVINMCVGVCHRLCANRNTRISSVNVNMPVHSDAPKSGA